MEKNMEDYYAYKDRVRNAWALSKEGVLDRKENEALKKRIKAIAQKKLGKRYNDRSLDWVGSSSKSRGDRVVSQLDTLTNYWDPNDYKTTRRYMSNKTRRKITWNR